MSQSADVIELGSSDEEPEPAAKKPKRLNAMVSIPSTARPKRGSQRPSSAKVQVAPSLQNLIKNPFANKQLLTSKKIVNGKLGHPQPKAKFPGHQVILKQGIPQNIFNNVIMGNKVLPLKNAARSLVNPASLVTAVDMERAGNILKNLQLAKKLPQQTSIPIKIASAIGSPMHPKLVARATSHTQVSGRSHVGNRSIGKTQNFVTKTLKGKSPSGPPQLPPGITVTRLTGGPKRRSQKRPLSPANVTFKKQKLNSTSTVEVPTVELDDDDDVIVPEPTTSSPQWYVRPEDADKPKESELQEQEINKNHEPKISDTVPEVPELSQLPEPVTSVQGENYKEPEDGGRQMIEITIDDSPIKPPPIQATKAVSDLSIIIEDSPKQPKEQKQKKDEDLQDEQNDSVNKTKSRKKLNFPKKTQFIEVEVEFCNPIEVPVESDIPITDTINLDTPTKPEQLSVEPKFVKSKPPTPMKNNVSSAMVATTSIEVKKIKDSEILQSNTETESFSSAVKSVDSESCHKENQVTKSLTVSTEDNIVDFPKEAESNLFESANECKTGVKAKCSTSKPLATSHQKKVKDLESTNEKERNIFEDSKALKSQSIEIVPISVEQESEPKLSEFNETYQAFIDVCFSTENSDDMKIIVEKKVKEYYRQVDKSYTDSKDFIDFVSSKIKLIQLNPGNLYLYIKDIVDELKMRRKSSKDKTDTLVQEADPTDDVSFSDGGDASEASDGTGRNIRRLEKTLRKLHRAIQKLEEQEVDFDDETDSVYLLTESKEGNTSQAKDKPVETERQIQIKRYKARLVRVHGKLCQLTGTRMPSEAKVRLEARPGRPAGPTAKLERWINKKVPVGAPLPFPDFHDVVRCVREANTEDKLGWSDMEVMEEARDLFSRCGKRLQRRRQAVEWRIASSRLPAESDPADLSAELRRALDENKALAAKRETDVINKFADRQNQLKLEGEEIGENEADDSAPSSDDDVHAVDDEPNVISKEKNVSPLKVKRHVKENENSLSAVQEINKETTEEHATPAYAQKTVNEKCKENSISKEHDLEAKVMEIEDDSDTRDKSNANSNHDGESDSERIRLVLSDEDSIAEVKSIDCNSQNLLIQHQVVENVGSTLESSDSEAPIPICETQESSDSQFGSAKSSGVVSIENSSSDAEVCHGQVKPSTPSKEKLSLLEINESDEESGNICDSSENDNSAVPYEKVLIGSTEEDSNGCGNERRTKNTLSDNIQTDVDSNSKQSQTNRDNQNQAGIIEDVRDNSNSQVLSYDGNAHNSSNVNQIGDMPIDIGPTIIQGPGNVNIVYSSSDNQFSDSAIDVEPTIVQGTQSIDDRENSSSGDSQNFNREMDTVSLDDNENNSSSDNQNYETGVEIGTNIIQDTLSADDNEKGSSSDNQNSDNAMEIGTTIIQDTLSADDNEKGCSSHIQNFGVAIDIGTNIIQDSLSADDNEKSSSSDNQNSDATMEIRTTINQTNISADDNDNNYSSESQNLDAAMDTSTTIIQDTHSAEENENISSNDNQDSDSAMDIGPTVIGGTLSDNEHLSSSDNYNSNATIDIGPTEIQGATTIDNEISSDDNIIDALDAESKGADGLTQEDGSAGHQPYTDGIKTQAEKSLMSSQSNLLNAQSVATLSADE